MQAEKWNLVKKLLDEVLSLETSERRRFLDKSGANAEILSEVESLLAFETESEDLMRLSAVEFSRDFFDGEDAENPLVGQQIGNYKIIRELGQGGMGAVYLAERADGKFAQKIALKLLKREMNTAALRRRFQQEQAILASLEHPHIARLLDAGTTDDKIPFLAMEYVEGLPVDEYCNKHGLDLNQRLDLFRKVCAAVGFAHRNLVVHRDLKPSNILVGGEEVPKLLDFGISKILSAEFEQTDSATVTKLGVMTPAYASPEQLQSKSVTTATDIYSLGVILYELLSGHRPFEAKESDLKEIYLAVLESEPKPPSSVISDFGFGISDLKNRTVQPTQQTKKQKIQTNPQSAIPNPKSLSGDLDNIVLKALRKEPENRYSSAENLAEDIHRHQRGLPVTARPQTLLYRAEKFFKRNRAAVIGGILILLAVIGGIAATLWQARAARTERIKAEKRFNDVRALANSFLFEFSPKIENLPGSMPARELLVTRALQYLDNLSREAAGDTELQRELAKAYEKVGDVQGNPYNPNIGDTKGALESYEKAFAIRQSLAEKEPDNTKSRDEMADLLKRIGDLQSNGGDNTRAAEFYDRALELREKNIAENPQNFDDRRKLGELLRSRGLIPFFDGDNKKAIEYYTRAKEINEKLYLEQPENPKIAEQYAYIFVAIGEAQGWDSDFQGASINLQKGLDLLQTLAAKFPNELSIQRSLMLASNKRAENYQDLEEFDKGTELFNRGVEIAEKMLRADPQSFQARRDVAMGNKKLAQVLDDAGKSRESLKKLSVTLKMFQELNLADPKNTEYPYDVANTRYSIGNTFLTMKDYDSALKTLQTARDEFQVILDKTPELIYARRMSSLNLQGIGKCFTALAEKSNRREHLQQAFDSFTAALERFKKLRSEGKLGDVDNRTIAELEKEIEALKSKLKN